MKKLCLILAYLFLFTQTASAMPLLVGQKVVYRGTITDLRISAVDGTAFIDNLPYLYQSDFSAGEDSCAGLRTTISGNIDTIGGENDWLRVTLNNEIYSHFVYLTSISLTIGKKYTLSIKYYIPSGQTVVSGILLSNSGSRPSGVTFQNTLDSSTIYTVTFTAVGTEIRFYATNASGNNNIQDAGGDDVFYIKDIKISEIQPFMDGNHSIEIYDSSNRMLKGVLKAVGTGETLGSALNVSNCINSGTLPYSTFDGASATGFHIISSGTGDFRAGSADELNFTGQWLVKATLDATLTSGEAPAFAYCKDNFGIYIAGTVQIVLVAGGNTIYRTITTPTTGQARLRNTAATETTIANMAIKQVLTPSSSGATIVSAKGGEVYNFSYKNDSFTYNAASHYVIIRAIR